MKQESYVFFLNEVERALSRALHENPEMSAERRAELEEMRCEVASTLQDLHDLQIGQAPGSAGGKQAAAGGW